MKQEKELAEIKKLGTTDNTQSNSEDKAATNDGTKPKVTKSKKAKSKKSSSKDKPATNDGTNKATTSSSEDKQAATNVVTDTTGNKVEGQK